MALFRHRDRGVSERGTKGMFKNSPVGANVFSILLYGVGLGSISAMVWLAGPYIAFGDFRPLDNYLVREIVIVLLVAGFAGMSGFTFWKRRKNAEALAEGVAGDANPDDSETLNERMKDALATLKASSGGKADFLY